MTRPYNEYPNKPNPEPIEQPKAKIGKPVITVTIENYVRIIKLLNLLNADLSGIETVFKELKYDSQQDALKYSHKMKQDIARMRRILFPGGNFDA